MANIRILSLDRATICLFEKSFFTYTDIFKTK